MNGENGENGETVEQKAEQLATNLKQEITNASSRSEHIRLTRLAIEADELLAAIKNGYTK